mgnify:CR=1 FL=1
MEKYKDSDVELMSILLKLQEQTSPIRMSIGYTVGGTVRQGIILYEAAPKVIETLIEKGYTEPISRASEPRREKSLKRTANT